MEEAIPYHDSSCSSQVDEVEEEAARSCDPIAAVEAEDQGCKPALSPSLGCSMGIFGLVCILKESVPFLLDWVCFEKDSVVRQPDL